MHPWIACASRARFGALAEASQDDPLKNEFAIGEGADRQHARRARSPEYARATSFLMREKTFDCLLERLFDHMPEVRFTLDH